MQAGRIADEPLEGPGAWTVEDPDYYEFLVSQDVPRSGCLLRALKSDLRSWRVIRYWSTGLGLVALGAGTVFFSAKSDSWSIIAFGMAAIFMGGRLLFAMLRLFIAFVRGVRHGPVLRGRIPSLGRNSVIRGISTLNARLPDGRSVLVSVEIAPALALLGAGAPAEVLIHAAPDEKSGMVIGLRPIPAQESPAPTSTPPHVREDPDGPR